MEGALYGIMVPDSGAGAGVGGLTAASAGVPSRRPRYWCSYCCWHWLKVTLVHIGTYLYTLVDALSGGGWVAGWPGWCPKYATLAASPHHLCQLLSVTHSLPHQPTSSTRENIWQNLFDQLQTVFLWIANCIWPNCKLHLSLFQDIFVQISISYLPTTLCHTIPPPTGRTNGKKKQLATRYWPKLLFCCFDRFWIIWPRWLTKLSFEVWRRCDIKTIGPHYHCYSCIVIFHADWCSSPNLDLKSGSVVVGRKYRWRQSWLSSTLKDSASIATIASILLFHCHYCSFH